jgi:transposase
MHRREASRTLSLPPVHLSERQVQRLKRRYQPDSIEWVHHGNGGRVMPWAISAPQKQLILTLARGKYVGFNDSHLTEKLCAEEGLALSRESVRRILRAAKLASPQKRRPRQYRSRRAPRPRFGMMALTDASRHDWLEGRVPELTLIGFQDDATHKILAAHFQLEAENTVGYLFSLRTMILTHGIPLSLYRDRHAIFQRNDAHWTVAEQLVGKQSPTQLGRALEQLGIQQIPAFSPQAKGRIERAWRTFQDRLISELRLAGAATLAEANAGLEKFCADYNQRFARPAADAVCDFRRLPRRFDLARCVSLHYQRVVNADHTVTLGAACHRPAPVARPSRLRRRNRRTLPSVGRHPPRLSRRRSPACPALAAPRTCPTSPCTDYFGAEKKIPMPRIYNLSGRPALATVT